MADQQNPLSDNEKQELKALQDERKATGGHMSDSSRLRLSELQNREKPGALTGGSTADEDKPKQTFGKK
jgi:hypothetical protein